MQHWPPDQPPPPPPGSVGPNLGHHKGRVQAVGWPPLGTRKRGADCLLRGGGGQTHTPCAPHPCLSLCSYRQGQRSATLAVRGSTGLALLRFLASDPPTSPPPLPPAPTGGIKDVGALWACTWWWLWRARSETAMSIPIAACLGNLRVCRCPHYLNATTRACTASCTPVQTWVAPGGQTATS